MPGGYKLFNHNFKKENEESFKILLQLMTYLIFNGIMYQIYFLLIVFYIYVCVCVYIYIPIQMDIDLFLSQKYKKGKHLFIL